MFTGTCFGPRSFGEVKVSVASAGGFGSVTLQTVPNGIPPNPSDGGVTVPFSNENTMSSSIAVPSHFTCTVNVVMPAGPFSTFLVTVIEPVSGGVVPPHRWLKMNLVG